MKKVIIATSNNAAINNALHRWSTIPVKTQELSLGMEEVDVFKTDFSNALFICEINKHSLDWILTLSRKSAHINLHIFCICPNIDELNKQVLIDNGICDVMNYKDPQFIISCVNAIYLQKSEPSNGTMCILSNDQPFFRIVEAIAQRFRFIVHRTNTIDELITRVENEFPSLILVDMDTKNFSSIEFVKKTLYHAPFKKSILIIYKDTRSGLFVYDIPKSINRLTQAILSREELINMLLTLFFYTEITVPFDTIHRYALTSPRQHIPSLRNTFLSVGFDLCFATQCFAEENFSKILNASATLSNLLFKIEPLRWLIVPLEKNLSPQRMSKL